MMKKQYIYQKRTPYGKIEVADQDGIRWLLCNHRMQSAVDMTDETELVFPYMRCFSYAFTVNPDIHSTLLIGGGAFSYPRFYLIRYEDKQIDVAEISKDILDVDERYFGLGYWKQNHRLGIYQMDGIDYLKSTSKKYDLIINDAFIGAQDTVRNEMSTHLIHEHLHENGIYLVNVTGAVKGLFSHSSSQFHALLKREFIYTSAMQCEEDRSVYERQNILMAASDMKMI